VAFVEIPSNHLPEGTEETPKISG